MNEADSPKGIPQMALIGAGVLVAVVVVGLLIYFARASDPAARGPIPYQKIDYGAHMEQQKRELNRRTPTDPSSMR